MSEPSLAGGLELCEVPMRWGLGISRRRRPGCRVEAVQGAASRRGRSGPPGSPVAVDGAGGPHARRSPTTPVHGDAAHAARPPPVGDFLGRCPSGLTFRLTRFGRPFARRDRTAQECLPRGCRQAENVTNTLRSFSEESAALRRPKRQSGRRKRPGLYSRHGREATAPIGP